MRLALGFGLAGLVLATALVAYQGIATVFAALSVAGFGIIWASLFPLALPWHIRTVRVAVTVLGSVARVDPHPSPPSVGTQCRARPTHSNGRIRIPVRATARAAVLAQGCPSAATPQFVQAGRLLMYLDGNPCWRP